MSFFKEFKEDLSQAVNELLPDEEVKETYNNETADTIMEEEISAAPEVQEEQGELAAFLNSEEPIETDEFILPDLPEIEEPVLEEKPMEENPVSEFENEEAVTPAETLEEPLAVKKAEEQYTKPVPVVSSILEDDYVSDENAIITQGMRIKGNLESDGSIEIVGEVTGDVFCKGKLVITGRIVGNSKASEIFADKARITGEISCDGAVKVGYGTVIVGNISATSAVIAGAVNGDIDVHGPVVVDSSAVVMGNIKSRSVQINSGAVIEGFCSQCYSEVNVKTFFEDRG